MIPEAKIKKTKFSVIWLIPLVALITGLWMMYDNYSEKGTQITLEFKNGEGITENKTVIKYAGIKIGIVEEVKLNSNFDSVIVKAVIEKEYSHFAKENSLFWLVKPRLEVGGISGIETIFSGQYIAVRPGDGQKQLRFKALENPPPSSQTAPGLHLVLEAEDLGNLVPGSPVLYKKINVGKIESHSLSDKGENVLVNILINPKYTHLVNKETRFWNVSGISIKGDLSGIKIDTGTLSSVIDGGIAFDTPESEKNAEPAGNNDKYTLYNNKEKAMEQGFLIKVEFDTGEGLVPGSTPVKYKGINIGKVINVDADNTCKTITADILLKEKAKNFATKNSKFWMVKPRLDLTGISGLSTIISGQYIEVQPSPGEPETEFKALSAPPFSDPDAPGLHIILKADSAKSLSEGSPVFTRGLEAGRVEGFEITDKGVNISVHIFAKYAKKVGTDSRFWNNSGFSVSGDLSGVKVDAGNLQSLVSGAISFDTPSKIEKKADSGSKFRLYADKEKAFATEKTIKISFDNASGLKKGITPLKYKGIEVGKITDIKYNKSNDNFIAEINIYPSAPDLAKDGSVFFAVRPQINLSGVKGLETVIGGTYINVYKGNGKRKSSFKAKDSPPPVHPDLTGKKINLIADKVDSPNKGSLIFYKGFEAGIVQDTKIKNDKIIIKALIYDNFSDFLYTDTKFFKSGGIDFSADLSGININTENLESIIKGGISFDEPEKSSKKVIENKTDFTLHKNRKKAMEDGFLINLKLKSGYGIKENSTKIIYKGIKLGEIRDIKIDKD
ncbi:MAG: MlaD family protein, partial [Thermodesulfobacteriota bacterium]